MLTSSFSVIACCFFSEEWQSVTYFWGSTFVTVCDRKDGVKIIKNSVIYFMDGPVHVWKWRRKWKPFAMICEQGISVMIRAPSPDYFNVQKKKTSSNIPLNKRPVILCFTYEFYVNFDFF